jgi:hypothetical protein
MKLAKICPNCNSTNPNNAEFCQNCGNDLKNVLPEIKNSGGASNWWNKQSTGGKAAIGLAGICCVGLILILAISGMFSSDKTATTAPPVTNTSTSTPTQTTTNTTSTSTNTGLQIHIIYSGSWSGSYGDESGQQSIDGTGDKIITLSGNPNIVSVVMQKQDGGSGTLTVEILENGKVLETRSTSAEYGVVSVSHSFF